MADDDISYDLFYLLGLCLCSFYFQSEGFCDLQFVTCYFCGVDDWKRGCGLLWAQNHNDCYIFLTFRVLPLSEVMEEKSMYKVCVFGLAGAT